MTRNAVGKYDSAGQGALRAVQSESLRGDVPMIVQCPSCQTKFALDKRAKDEVDRILKTSAADAESESAVVPRFHCSRCDHVFNLEAAPAPFETPAVKPMAPLPDVSSAVSPASQGSVPDPQPLSNLRNESYRGLEIPSAFAPESATIEPPHEVVPNEDIGADSSAQMSFAFPPLGIGRHSISGSVSSPGSLENIERDKTSFASLSQTSLSEESSELPYTVSSLQGKPPSSWAGFAIFVAPLFLTLTVLTAVSLYVRSNPEAAITLSDNIFPGAVQVAPTALFLKSARFKKVVLDSGDVAYVVSGRITNDTKETFREVVIEAIAFDTMGKPIQRTAVSASNGLNRAKIRSLTPEMIRGMQSAEPTAGYSLKAGTEQDFVVALGEGGLFSSGDSDKLSEARYFSARIHSVRK